MPYRTRSRGHRPRPEFALLRWECLPMITSSVHSLIETASPIGLRHPSRSAVQKDIFLLEPIYKHAGAAVVAVRHTLCTIAVRARTGSARA